MIYLNACYGFNLVPQVNQNSFILQPNFKVGNIQEFNDLFDSDHLIKLKKIGPVKEMNDYIALPMEYSVGNSIKKLIFETISAVAPYGIVRVPGNDYDCFLYRLISDHKYEVYISQGNASQSSQLLIMLIEGLLCHDIDELYKIGFL